MHTATLLIYKGDLPPGQSIREVLHTALHCLYIYMEDEPPGQSSTETLHSITLLIYIYVTGTKTGLEKRRRDSKTSVINGYLAWMQVGVQMNHGSSSARAQWFSCQNGGGDYRDTIK